MAGGNGGKAAIQQLLVRADDELNYTSHSISANFAAFSTTNLNIRPSGGKNSLDSERFVKITTPTLRSL